MVEPDGAPRGPLGRRDVLFRRVGEDWVLFDARAQRVHVLNLTAALIWSYCTGAHPVEEIERAVRDAYGGVADPGVRGALDEFGAAGLLDTP